MGRTLKRVPMDFQWPLTEVWDGYLRPDRLRGTPCPDCIGQGWSRQARRLRDLWYGDAPFDPTSTGSTPLRPDSPAVRAFAERNVASAPGFYGTGELAVRREALRLATLWNSAWRHHLSQEDVDALVAEDRLIDLTHARNPETGRLERIDPPVTPTAAEVNEWSLTGFGHDSLNAYIVIRARCERDGRSDECAVCDGHGSTEDYPGQRSDAEAWQRTEPPEGDGFQLWETTSEGAPISPVFETIERLCEHAAENCTVFGGTKASAEQWRKMLDDDFVAVAQVAADGTTHVFI